jgi:hypothetical protein
MHEVLSFISRHWGKIRNHKRKLKKKKKKERLKRSMVVNIHNPSTSGVGV